MDQTDISPPPETSKEPLPPGLVGQPAPVSGDIQTAAAEEWWWKKMWKKEHAEVVGMYLDIALRFIMCAALLGICYMWLERVCSIVEKQSEENHKPLSDAVLITLLTTTTANILGLLVIVVGYLFPRRADLKNISSIEKT